MKKVVKVFLYVWQLPQNLLGLLLLCFYKCEMHFRVKSLTPEVRDLSYFTSGVTFTEPKKSKYCNPVVHICPKFKSGISLGDVIIVKNYSYLTIRHEYGHSYDSMLFGPLYLIVIGIPSLFHNMMYEGAPNDPNGYFKFWTERSADKNGGIKRI